MKRLPPLKLLFYVVVGWTLGLEVTGKGGRVRQNLKKEGRQYRGVFIKYEG